MKTRAEVWKTGGDKAEDATRRQDNKKLTNETAEKDEKWVSSIRRA